MDAEQPYLSLPEPSLPPSAQDLAATPEGRSLLRMLSSMFAQAPVGFALLDADLRFVLVNESMAQVNGLSVAEHLGRPLRDVLPGIDDDAAAMLKQVLDTGEPLRQVEISGTVPASAERRTWVEDFSRVETAGGEVIGVAAVLVDVTAERRSARRLRQLIDSLFSFVGLCAPDGTLLEANRAALTVGGVTADDVLGRKLWETPWFAWSEEVVEQARRSVFAGAAGEPTRLDLEVATAAGHVLIDYLLVPVVEGDEVVALVPSATDVTTRRRSTEQAGGLATLARRLNAVITADEVVAAIHAHAPAAVGCRAVRVDLFDERGAGLPVEDPAAVTTPLAGADGVPLGSLTLCWAGPLDLLPAEEDDELRVRIETVAELCAQSLERARLTDAHVVAAQRTGSLAALAGALASANGLDEVLTAIARLTPPVVGASAAALGLLDDDGRVLRVSHDRSFDASVDALYGRQAIEDDLPHATAARTRRPVYLGSIAAFEGRFPTVLPQVVAAGLEAAAVLPLEDSRDRVIGTIGVGWPAPVRFDPVLRAMLDTVAGLCGQTLERARLHQAEHEFVGALQRRFLHPLPHVPGADLDATYRAAQASVGIGGDFYDALVVPDGRLALVLGDVAGHGMAAAADMAQLRTVLSTLLAAGVPLDRLFERAETVLAQVATMSLATAVAAVVDASTDTLTYVHAGHPPLVVRVPGEPARTLDDARGALLGLDLPQGDVGTIAFPPGSVLLGYTDGLVETRRSPLDVGIDRVVAAVQALPEDPTAYSSADVAAVVLEHCVGDRPLEDDVALLVMRRLG